MAADLELQDNESLLKEIKGDYWEKFLFMYTQKTGKYWFTNQRIIFRGGFATELILFYSDIEKITKCTVGPFIPTGIKVLMKDGKKYKLSILERKKTMELIESNR